MSKPLFYQCIVLDNQDPLMLGRVRARIVTDTPSKNKLLSRLSGFGRFLNILSASFWVTCFVFLFPVI